MKTPILIAVMLTFSLAASAQKSESKAASSSSGPHATVEGCLNQPSAGNFVLVRTSGKKYFLTGNPATFEGLTGKEVRIYGALKAANPLAAMRQSQAEMAAGPPEEIVVETVDKLYDTCEHGAAGPPGEPEVVTSHGKQ